MKSQILNIVKTLVFTITTLSTNAQQINTNSTTNVLVNDIRTHMSRFNDESESNIKGSPYINTDFALVKINQVKDSIFSARYNAFTHEMEILSRDSKIRSLDANVNYDVKFISTNKLYRSVSYVNSYGITVHRFLVVLSENKTYSLFKEEHVKFFEKVEAKSSYGKEKPASYKRTDDIYFIKIENQITTIPLKKKQLLKVFPKHAKALKDYMKAHKLNLKNEKHLIKIAEYLSTLIQ